MGVCTRSARVALLLTLIVLASGHILPDSAQAQSSVHLVLNEIELDPPGAARQWVEIYNPTTNAIDLTDWTLESRVLPKTKISEIDPDRADYWIFAGGFYVFEIRGLPLATLNEFLILRDTSDTKIDKAPSETDTITDAQDNDFTWSRYPNGFDTDSLSDWRFILSTRATFNDLSPTVFGDKIAVFPGRYDYFLSTSESLVKRDYPKSTVFTDSLGDLLFLVNLTGKRWGFRIYIPPEFGIHAIEPWVVWTGATNDYNAISIGMTGGNDPIAPGWWVITIEPVDNPVDRNHIGLPIPRLMPPLLPSKEHPYQFHVRVFNVRAPSIAGRYFFKAFVLVEGSSTYASIGATEFPTLVVKSGLNPAYISGTIRYGGWNTSLYGWPIHFPGKVMAEGLTAQGRYVRGLCYFNASANGRYTLYGLAAGTYTLTAVAKGFRPIVLGRRVGVSAGQSLDGVDIYIVPGVNITEIVRSKDAMGIPMSWGSELSITVDLLDSAKVDVVSVPGTTNATLNYFNFTFWYKDLDGHIPQSFSEYVSGILPGPYYLNATVADYTQREFFQIVTNERSVSASREIDLFKFPPPLPEKVKPTFTGNLNLTVYSVNWQTPPTLVTWTYDNKHITVVLYNATGEEISSLVLHQNKTRTYVTGLFGGLIMGSYFVRGFTPGYNQLSTRTVYVYENATSDISVNLVRAPKIDLTVLFKTQNIFEIPTRKTDSVKLNFYGNFTPIRVEVYASDGRLAGANISYIPPETYFFNMSLVGFDGYAGNPNTRIWGGWANYFDATDGRLRTDSGLAPGTYTIKAWVPGYTQPKMILAEVKLGQTASVLMSLDKIAHLKGRFSSSGVGWVDMWDTVQPNSWATITVRNSSVLVTYPLDGDFDVWLLPGTHTVTVEYPPYGFLAKQTMNVSLSPAAENPLTFIMEEPGIQVSEFAQSRQVTALANLAVLVIAYLATARKSTRWKRKQF